jgi:4-amino-4-deoxy-L-arabinose transferase-like glycosyltransferase
VKWLEPAVLVNPSVLWLAVILGGLAGLRLLYLTADFPSGLDTYGMTYTDEGWWARNAIALLRDGHWYIDDGYNTVFNLPVLPMLQALWFKVFGISLGAARSLSVLCTLIIGALIYAIARCEIKSGLAWIAPFMVLSSYPIFVYSRLALLEMPMLMLILISLWLAISARHSAPDWRAAKILSSAVFLALAVLTKTTALFALPVLVVLIYLQPGRQKRKILNSLTWLLAFALPVGLFFWFSSQGDQALSYQHFAGYNVSGKVHQGAFSVAKGPLRVIKYSLALFPLLLIGLSLCVATLWTVRRYRNSPLFQIVVLWICSMLAAFSVSNYAAPRYFVVWIVPAALAMPLAIEYLLRQHTWHKPFLLSVFALSTVVNLSRIAVYISMPEFTLVNMADTIEATIEANPRHSPVVMGHFADTIALAENLEAINDKMGFRDLDYRIKTFNPGYYVSTGAVERDISPTLESYYRLDLLEKFDVYHNYDFGEPVFFYQLTPKAGNP